MADAQDVFPTQERADEHVRQVRPGNHVAHLAAKDIAYLNEKFAKPIEYFGYKDFMEPRHWTQSINCLPVSRPSLWFRLRRRLEIPMATGSAEPTNAVPNPDGLFNVPKIQFCEGSYHDSG